MKRVKAACICQTLHFMLKEELGHNYAAEQVKKKLSTINNRSTESIHSIKL